MTLAGFRTPSTSTRTFISGLSSSFVIKLQLCRGGTLLGFGWVNSGQELFGALPSLRLVYPTIDQKLFELCQKGLPINFALFAFAFALRAGPMEKDVMPALESAHHVARLDRTFPTDMPMKVRAAVRTLAMHVFVNPSAVRIRADHCSLLYCRQLQLVLKRAAALNHLRTGFNIA